MNKDFEEFKKYVDNNLKSIYSKVSVEELEFLHNLTTNFNRICEENENLEQENKQLKDNWNKLREWIVYHKHNENTEEHYLVVDYGTLLGKMQELESGDSNE